MSSIKGLEKMKDFFINYIIRCVLGYFGIIALAYFFTHGYDYLVYLTSKHVIVASLVIFFTLVCIDSVIVWVKIKLQLKGVGGKSRHQSEKLK